MSLPNVSTNIGNVSMEQVQAECYKRDYLDKMFN